MPNKRKCICCGREYDYCPNCSKGNKPLWMLSFDKALCKELFNIVSLYNMHQISKEDVQRFAANNGIVPSSYTEPVKKVLLEASTTLTDSADTPLQDDDSEPLTMDQSYHRRKKKKHYWI